jgi:glycosyltransferase involved in cell wall biosynthesis
MNSVSVIIPCYNYARYLRGCVESVLSQEGVDVRVLVIDDASPDNTPEVGAKLAAEDGRVEFRRHAVNQRHIATYNEGLAWATGDYTLLLSADDLLTPGALARAARTFDSYPDVGLLYGRQILFNTNATLPDDHSSGDVCHYRIADGESFVATLCASGSNPVNTPTAIVRTRLLAEVGGYCAELPHTADMDLWLRFAVRSSVAILDANQAFKRMHGQNMQIDFTAGVLGDMTQRKAAFDGFFRRCGDLVKNREHLNIMAMRALGTEAFWAASTAFDRGDTAHCQTLINFALEVDPQITSRPEWYRFCWKRRFGKRVWSMVRPIVAQFQRRSAPVQIVQ